MRCALLMLLALPLADATEQRAAGRAPLRCPDYEQWSQTPHAPASRGKLGLPFQRPPKGCRTFHSPAVEAKLEEVKAKIMDEDVARLWENAFPNTLDTTIKYHRGGAEPLTFIVTGDIDAEWLRDSQHQLRPYLTVLKQLKREELAAEPLADLLRGAIALQARYVSRAPHCNAFQAPPEAGLRAHASNEGDAVFPYVSPYFAFECKYELDSLASFLGLSNDYYEATGDDSFVTHEWRTAAARLIQFVNRTTASTHGVGADAGDDEDAESSDGTAGSGSGSGSRSRSEIEAAAAALAARSVAEPYMFRRWTNLGSETHWNNGAGHPARYTGMARSWFRPSDDACVFQFFVPANAQMSVELQRMARYYESDVSDEAKRLAKQISDAVWKHAVRDHPEFGKVFAYEVDGFGGALFMDDANLPSLLALPDMGFLPASDKTYQRTRKMVLSQRGNPYYIKGRHFEGIGGPHVGLRAAWPMSRIVAMRTSSSLPEIREHLRAVVHSTKGLGLVHESVDVDTNKYTRPWFAWANSEFAKAILDLDERGILEKATRDLI